MMLATNGARQRANGSYTALSSSAARLMMRFRLGCWPLEVNRPETGVAREHRGVVEDERHVLLECPEYDAERTALQPEDLRSGKSASIGPPGLALSRSTPGGHSGGPSWRGMTMLKGHRGTSPASSQQRCCITAAVVDPS
ncbi:hypothetical protein TSOC_002809 [Tetrabaena socialis]|uniref:Uncharacterized protein n=1 Tax=Tetrabaena socialis TaxID=47790 RepID=A0A2J8AD74_9CHLO|nr:hypothetical protein TSOC_002809 [Tetrabaena socialis]|eukprot:PNH10459.1 hypothetical protein TSOC_002809 [Tetrabaena socialis]